MTDHSKVSLLFALLLHGLGGGILCVLFLAFSLAFVFGLLLLFRFVVFGVL
jgi:hypothetical protein